MGEVVATIRNKHGAPPTLGGWLLAVGEADTPTIAARFSWPVDETRKKLYALSKQGLVAYRDGDIGEDCNVLYWRAVVRYEHVMRAAIEIARDHGFIDKTYTEAWHRATIDGFLKCSFPGGYTHAHIRAVDGWLGTLSIDDFLTACHAEAERHHDGLGGVFADAPEFTELFLNALFNAMT